MGQTITMLDCETGGLIYNENPITQIALINFDHDSFNVNWEYKAFFKPYHDLEIDPIVYKLTTVTPEDVKNGEDSKKVVKDLIKLLKESNSSNGHARGKTILGGHNAIAFDREFIEYLFLLEGHDVYDYVSKEWVDTLPLAKAAWPKEAKYNLTACCKKIKYNLTGAHGALADTRATFEVYKNIVKQMRGSSGKNQPMVESSLTPEVIKEQSKNRRNFFQF